MIWLKVHYLTIPSFWQQGKDKSVIEFTSLSGSPQYNWHPHQTPWNLTSFVNSKCELHTSPCILYAFTTTQMEKRNKKTIGCHLWNYLISNYIVFSVSYCVPTLPGKNVPTLPTMGQKQVYDVLRELTSYRSILKTYPSVAEELLWSILWTLDIVGGFGLGIVHLPVLVLDLG